MADLQRKSIDTERSSRAGVFYSDSSAISVRGSRPCDDDRPQKTFITHYYYYNALYCARPCIVRSDAGTRQEWNFTRVRVENINSITFFSVGYNILWSRCTRGSKPKPPRTPWRTYMYTTNRTHVPILFFLSNKTGCTSLKICKD